MVELIWDGKYDKDGKRTAPPRLKLPFQTVETINESAQQRQLSLDMFSAGRQSEWRNRLIWGDKKYVLPALLDEFAGKVNLIYIDPPFNVGADFSFNATISDNPETEDDEASTFLRQPSIIEQKAYRDTWGRGLDSYLRWFHETTTSLYELLASDGCIFIHLDWHISHAAKLVLDEVFGVDNFRNEIILPGRAVKNLQQQFTSISRLQVRHDVMFWYSKSPTTRFEPYWIQKHNLGNPEGHWHHFWSTADRPTMRYELFGVTPKSGQWVWKKDRALLAVSNYERYLKENGGRTLAEYWRDTGSVLEFVRPDPDDGKPQYWRAPAETRMADTVWSGIPVYSNENNYPTEKNEAFLTEVINLASKEGDLVLDCFCGSGTTAAVAEKLNRRWITCDLGRFAIHTTRKRLFSIPDVKPFIVQNLGKYERQAWQAAEFGGEKKAAAMVSQYRHFILDLFHARPIEGYTWLHGIRDGRMVHVGPVDSPISPNDVT
jgi:adenine-specific DNA-methyltransferase